MQNKAASKENAEKILAYWYDGLTDRHTGNSGPQEGAFMKKVYMGGEKVDNECKEFLECHTALLNGELEEWIDEPQSALAYCILAD